MVERTNTLWTALWGKYRMNWTQLGICIKVPHQSSQLVWQSAQALPRSSDGMLFEMPLVFIFQALPHTQQVGLGLAAASQRCLTSCEGWGVVETRRTGDIRLLVSNTNFSLNC